uniref:Uncharacterized protein n=1 Tax=Sphenodon punctatus TaxID=8508 RepID=A0A8D0G7P8_SPHPU
MAGDGSAGPGPGPGPGLVRLDLGSLRGASRAPVHLLPCVVEHDGSAAVDRYFTPAIRPQGGRSEKAVSFRGRSLQGQEVPVPQGYVGLVLKEDAQPCLEEEEERTVRVKSVFTELTAWNLEQAPSGDDGILMAMSWPKISEGLHAPVPEEEP